MSTIRSIIHRYYQQLAPVHQDLIARVRLALANFVRDSIAGTAAAGMAYYFIFSIFPLTLLLTSIMGYFMGILFVQDELSLALNMFLPNEAVQLLLSNVTSIITQQEAFGIAAFVGLTWSSLGLLGEVTRALDVIFNVPVPRTIFQQRFLGALMVIGLVFIATAMIVLLGLFQLMSAIMLNHPWLWLVVAVRITPISMNILIFALLFRRVPNCYVSWDAIWPAAMLGGFGWEFARLLLNWYLTHIARYSLIYGSISVVIILMLWAYLMSMVLLLSAEICARLNDWINANFPSTETVTLIEESSRLQDTNLG